MPRRARAPAIRPALRATPPISGGNRSVTNSRRGTVMQVSRPHRSDLRVGLESRAVPFVGRQVLLKGLQRRGGKIHDQQSPAAVAHKILASELVPILRTTNAELLAEPLHVFSPMGAAFPISLRGARQEPRFPRIRRAIL